MRHGSIWSSNITDRAGNPMMQGISMPRLTLIAALAAATLAAMSPTPSTAAGTATDAEREEIMARARAEHAERQRQRLLSTGDEPAGSTGEAARRQQELDDLSARLQKAEERRKGGAMPALEPAPSRLRRGEVSDVPLDARSEGAERVAVLLVMNPGNRGIRRLVKTADPVLCVDRNCYISRGALAPAAEMSRARALGAGNTLGARAGACRDSLACVFRGVTIAGPGAIVQPVDLRIIKHDRREAHRVAPDRSCRVERFRLVCDGALHAADYSLWLVPERLAENIGPAALEAAVAGGLGGTRMLSARAR